MLQDIKTQKSLASYSTKLWIATSLKNSQKNAKEEEERRQEEEEEEGEDGDDVFEESNETFETYEPETTEAQCESEGGDKIEHNGKLRGNTEKKVRRKFRYKLRKY